MRYTKKQQCDLHTGKNSTEKTQMVDLDKNVKTLIANVFKEWKETMF